ncbi:MAG TPA: hypothetical protein VFQ25_02860 [Ktedonobacterales bacterium]|nr:hypothetical protein [Ktedonobacterales bacterium]
MSVPAPTGAPAATAAPAPVAGHSRGGPTRPATGFFHPRWLLLAGVWYMPAAIAGFGIHHYFTERTCQLDMLNALCWLDVMAAPGQVALMLAGFVITLFVASTYGRSHDLDRTGAQPAGFTWLMWRMTDYQRVRPLTWALAAVVALGLALEVIRGQLDGVTLALGLIALGVCLRCAAYHPRRPEQPHVVGADSVAREDTPGS